MSPTPQLRVFNLEGSPLASCMFGTSVLAYAYGGHIAIRQPGVHAARIWMMSTHTPRSSLPHTWCRTRGVALVVLALPALRNEGVTQSPLGGKLQVHGTCNYAM